VERLEPDAMFGSFSDFSAWWRERVIRRIHGARVVLPAIWGVPAHVYMGFVYPIPVLVGGYYVMQWAIGKSHENIGERGEKLRGRSDLQNWDSATRSQNAALQSLLTEHHQRRTKDDEGTQQRR